MQALPKISDELCIELFETGQIGRLIEHHLYLPPIYAWRHRHCQIDREELVAEGNLALVECPSTFHPHEQLFRVHAGWCIQRSLWRFIADIRLVKISKYSQTLLNELLSYTHDVWMQLGQQASTEILMAQLRLRTHGKVSQTTLREVVNMVHGRVISVDVENEEETEMSLSALGLATESDVVEKEVLGRREMELALHKLNALQLQIIVMRYGLQGWAPHTREEVAIQLNMKTHQILRAETQAFDAMRH